VAPLDPDACYRALARRDRRFDGRFFVGVTTTGIYCRPICPARTPGRDRCRFFRTTAEAEAEGFRACFRCRPNMAIGMAPIDARARVALAAQRAIEAGTAADEMTLGAMAASVGVSSRHLRRAVRAEMGTSPRTLVAARRLRLARRLIVGSALSMTEVAFASGYGSVRRFNAAVKARFGLPPSRLRQREQGAGTR
jgi:AraC family transcriptional regulator of adaptative response / DNA-3-methyladenine glycosylase II